MNGDEAKTKAMSLWDKIKAAYKSNPLAEKRAGEITCPKCGAKNMEVAVSCKECGEKFEYKSAKKGVILGVGLTASIILLLVTAWMCNTTSMIGGAAQCVGDHELAATAEDAHGISFLLWAAAVAGIVATVASYKMKNWGWKLQTIVVGIYVLTGLSDGIGTAFVMLLLISPLAVSTWLGYKVLQEAGRYLDALHGIGTASKNAS